MVKQIINEFEDFAGHKQVNIVLTEQAILKHSGNKDLAGILISNLFKNAIFHTPSGTDARIIISSGKIQFENPGTESLENNKIFSRFKGAEKADSTGLGLAISKAIAQKMNLNLSYTYSPHTHIFSIDF